MTTTITLEQAQAQLDALLATTSSDTLTVRYADRSVTYRSASEIQEQITYWTRMIKDIKRINAGANRHGFAVADFRRRS